MLEFNVEEKKKTKHQQQDKKRPETVWYYQTWPICQTVEGVYEQLELGSIQIICVVHR